MSDLLPPNNLFRWPTISKAITQRAVMYSSKLGPFGKRCRFIANGQKHTPASIAGLLRVCCPPYVSRFIVSVIVYAVNGVLRAWAFTDMVKKCHEVFSPFRVNLNSTAAISFITTGCRNFASSYHVSPYPVFLRICHAMTRPSVSIVADSLNAPAVFSTTSNKRTRQYKIFLAAVAQAKPTQGTNSRMLSDSNCRQHPKSLPGQVFESTILGGSIPRNHDSYSYYGLWPEPVTALQRCPARFILADSAAQFHYLLELSA